MFDNIFEKSSIDHYKPRARKAAKAKRQHYYIGVDIVTMDEITERLGVSRFTAKKRYVAARKAGNVTWEALGAS